MTCLYSADRVAVVTGVPHSLQNLAVGLDSRAAGTTEQPRRGQSTATIPAGVHVSIVSPLLGDVRHIAVISAVAFATILAVVAGLTITASTSFAHDIYASLIKRHKVTEREQVRVSRITAVVLGIFGIALGILANGQNIAFLVALAFAVAAAANLPTILYSLYWSPVQHPRCVVEHVRRPDLDYRPHRLLPRGIGSEDRDACRAWTSLGSPWPIPGIVSIPLAFVFGILGTLTSPDRGDPEINAEFEVRALTGVGAEKVVAAH